VLCDAHSIVALPQRLFHLLHYNATTLANAVVLRFYVIPGQGLTQAEETRRQGAFVSMDRVVDTEREKFLRPWKQHREVVSIMTNPTNSSNQWDKKLKDYVCAELTSYWDAMEDHEIAKTIISQQFSDFVDGLDVADSENQPSNAQQI
jgi:hypothetical protein